jgi:hypothetical protein
MKPETGWVPLHTLTDDNDLFIETVKNNVQYWGIKDIEFKNDYSAIRKMQDDKGFKHINKKQNENR